MFLYHSSRLLVFLRKKDIMNTYGQSCFFMLGALHGASRAGLGLYFYLLGRCYQHGVMRLHISAVTWGSRTGSSGGTSMAWPRRSKQQCLGVQFQPFRIVKICFLTLFPACCITYG